MLWNAGEDKMIDGLILSFQFFTRIPIKKAVDFNEKNMRYSLFFYPYVGAFIGSLAAAIYYPLSKLNTNIASLAAVFVLLFLTGGLHIDGLSDTFDGFLSSRDRERTLEIMKDSRVGTFGVISIIFLILSKFVIISSFEKGLPLALILSVVNSRLGASSIIANKKVARKGGLGDMFHKSNPRNLILINTVIYLVILIFTNYYYITPLVITFLFDEYFSRWSYKKIGGMTGDTYGAIIEIGEVISLFSFWGIWGIMQWI